MTQPARIPQPDESSPWLTMTMAARRLGVSSETIRRRVRTGTIPAVMVGARYLVKAEDVDALVRPVEAVA